MRHSKDPGLVDIVVGALPNLDLVAVRNVSVGKIKTESCTQKVNGQQVRKF